MTNEEFEQLWAELKAEDARREAEYNALSEEEKKCLEEEYSDPFYERISENPFGDDDN